MIARKGPKGDNSNSVKIGKFLLTFAGILFASLGTLLFQPTVFCEITLPVVAYGLGWKAKAVSARLSAMGVLEIREFEAVNDAKSRIAMDSGRVEFAPLTILSGRPEILRADFRFAMVDLEVTSPKEKKKTSPVSIPFSLREARVNLMEGRFRTETGAWILKSVQATAGGWDGETPREIRLQLGQLNWDGPGKQELATAMRATAQKSQNPSGGDVWDIQATTDVSTVIDLPPWHLVSPCQLVLEGKAIRSPREDWRVNGLKAVWQGIGGIRLAAKIDGTYAPSGNWAAEIQFEPTDLRLAGVFLQPRGIQSVAGSLGGAVKLGGGPSQPLVVELDLSGQAVQMATAGGIFWPSQPAALAFSSRGEWNADEGLLKVDRLSANLGRAGQPEDFRLLLDRPAVVSMVAKSKTPVGEAASLQWTARGLEMAALAPIFFDPAKLQVEGGSLSAEGSARVQGGRVGLVGRVDSRAMTASGRWLQGRIAVQSGSFDFQGYLDQGTQLHLESATVRASWEGGATEDLSFLAKAEWDFGKNQGFLAGDLAMGLTGLGKAWSGARFWPEDGQAKAHVEFSGNPNQKGSGLVSLGLSNMRWPGEKAGSWEAKLSSEVEVSQGGWTLPELVVQANRAGTPLLDGKVSGVWKPAGDEGRIKIELAKAESDFVVPLLKNFTPNWQWNEASGQGSFEFIRQNQHDRVTANLQAAVTVDTGTAQRPRPVDFSSVQGNVQASWPSGTSGVLSIDALALVAKHRDGSEAVRATLDAPLTLEKRGPEEWQPAGTRACSGLVQFGGWPMGILAPLVLAKADENSIAGTLSGFVRVQSDPARGRLQLEMDVSCPDFSVDLPGLRLTDNRTNVKAEAELGSDRTLAIRKVMVASEQAGKVWLELSSEKAAQSILAVVGKVDLAAFAQNVPAVTPYVSLGTMVLKANVGEPKAGVRKVGFSAEAQDLAVSLPEIGSANGLKAKVLGTLDWGKEGVTLLDDVQLTAEGFGGTLIIEKVDWKKSEAVSWESGRIPKGWVGFLAGSWLQPNRWVEGDLVLGRGFWEPGDHGNSGQIDVTVVEARISDQKKLASVSLRLDGNWDYDQRTHIFTVKDASMFFSGSENQPVEIPLLRAGPGLLDATLIGETLDLRGILDQYGNWQSAPLAAGNQPEPLRLDLSARLQKVIFRDASVGPVNISKFQLGPEGVSLQKASVEVQGGVITGSVAQKNGPDSPLQADLVVRRFPLGAILSPMIKDARGSLGGYANLEFSGQASGGRVQDLQQSLRGNGTFRLYEAHLENLPAIRKALQGAGLFLGSSLVAESKINDLGGSFQVAGSKISTQDLRILGSTLSASMRGWMDWMTQAIDFEVNLALTREAIQSSGQLQGAMTQLVGNSNEYYTKIPGSASITGTLADPKVQMDVAKMLLAGGINLLLNTPQGVLQGAGGAAGGAAGAAAGAAGSILQGVGNLFKGF